MFSSFRCRPQAPPGCKRIFRHESADELDLEAIVYAEAPVPQDSRAGASSAVAAEETSPTAAGFLTACRPVKSACNLPCQALQEELVRPGDVLPYQAASAPNLLRVEAEVPLAGESSTPYLRLEGDGELLDEDGARGEAERLLGDLAGVKRSVLAVAALATASTLLCMGYRALDPAEKDEARRYALLATIPVVALLFTWFHIWLAIQMMFLPLEFTGIWEYGSTGMGIGWQGLVPRKCEKMAKSSYKCARPFLEGPRDWLSRVDPKKLVAETRPELKQVIDGALSHVGKTYFPRADQRFPLALRTRLTDAALDKIQETSPELWKTITELLCDDTIGIDNDGMIVKVFTENKELLNQFFLTLGDREFRFIEHCGAAMGFLCGILQLVAFNHLSNFGRAVFLPVTGFLLGIVTNWLAILMVFKPCLPIPIRIFGWHVCDIQGLFLKRQQEVCVLYSKMLKDNFLSFNKVMEYLQTLPELWERLKAAYTAHSTRVLRQTMGSSATWLAEWTIGQQGYRDLEEDLKVALVQGLYQASRLHQVSGRYIGKVTDIEARNRESLQRMPPNEFENLLHPVFQEDEWILILLGGILGAIVGLAQVHFLSD